MGGKLGWAAWDFINRNNSYFIIILDIIVW